MDFVHHFARNTPVHHQPTACSTTNHYDGRMGIRISAIFVLWIGSTFGAVFPVFASRNKRVGMPDWVFFICKYFGSGVIIATAFIHLLAPANEALGNECLTGVIKDYPWPEGIALMMIFTMFLFEIVTSRLGIFGEHSHDHGHSHEHGNGHGGDNTHEPHHQHHDNSSSTMIPDPRHAGSISLGDVSKYTKASETTDDDDEPESPMPQHIDVPLGEDHLGHLRRHTDNPDPKDSNWEERGEHPESYAMQMTSIFILEFGVIFHSIFIGLTLAVAGDEFVTLYIVLVFHQTFEGLGLGARLAGIPWPKSKRWTPYILGFAFGLSTPIAMAIGLGIRKSYLPGSRTGLIANGVFDSVSAGILIYTGLVELMAHEFMFSPYMQKGPLKRVLSAFLLMTLGAFIMALLGKWA